jgi:hypothetical protein
MEYNRDVKVTDDYIIITVTGSYTGIKDTFTAFDIMIEEAVTHGKNKILLDISKVEGQIPLLDSYELGERAAKVWGHKYKIAILYQAEKIKGMFENVAVNRGGNVRVVPTFEKAETWLLGKD